MIRAHDSRLLTVVSWISFLSLLLGGILVVLWIVARLLLSYEREQDMHAFRAARSDPAVRSDYEDRVAFAVALPGDRPAPLSARQVSVQSAAGLHLDSEARRGAVTTRLPEGILRIPALDIRVPVYSGTDELTLNRGAGRIEWTPPLGAPGNVGVAAHRDGAFRALQDIAKGDEIFVDQLQGTLRYRVVDMHVVDPKDVHVLDQTTQPYLTLVTCYPFNYIGAAPQRFIVHASASPAGHPSEGKL